MTFANNWACTINRFLKVLRQIYNSDNTRGSYKGMESKFNGDILVLVWGKCLHCDILETR